MSILVALLSLTVMIIIHEWGHFITARMFKIPVYEFAIGMGPKIFKHKGKKETLYTIRAIPLGGFCSFDSEESIKNSAENGITDSALDSVNPWKRILICFAGPFMNLLTAFVIVFFISLFAGDQTGTTKVVDFMENSPSEEYLLVNDYIYSINGNVVYNDRKALTNEINNGMQNNDYLDVEIIRNDEHLNFNITPKYDENAKSYFLGIYQGNIYNGLGFVDSVKNSISTNIEFIKSIFISLNGLITGKYSVNDMSGIVGTVAFMGDYVKSSTLIPFFTLISLISVNLGIMNLLPIPALDGSKILFSFIEIIRKKPINKKVEAKAAMIGFMLLIGLSVVLIFNDILKLL